MTSLWRIFSSLLLTAAGFSATVSGRVTLERSEDRRVQSRRDYSGVVIWLEAPGTTHPEPRKAKMLQKGKKFTPHVLAIPVNSSVDFPNLDPIFHNAFSNFSGQIFDIGLYPPGSSRSVKFRREGVVRIFCNIHPAMSAVVVVLKTPFLAVTGKGGQFQIPDVPAGAYTLKVFHERATAAVLGALEKRITVHADTVLPPIVISEAGYIALPHKNKYGKDYLPPLDEVGPYSGARK